jgi:hypothetical protein
LPEKTGPDRAQIASAARRLAEAVRAEDGGEMRPPRADAWERIVRDELTRMRRFSRRRLPRSSAPA